MQVKILEERLKDSDQDTGERYNLGKGDIVTVSDKLGAYWCGLGWAEDVAGNVATGTRKVIGAELRVDNVKHKTATPEIGG